jgi:hypothetical protein
MKNYVRKKIAVIITYNKISENIFQTHFRKYFPKLFRIPLSEMFKFSEKWFPKKLTFWKMETEILEYEWKLKYWNMNGKIILMQKFMLF